MKDIYFNIIMGIERLHKQFFNVIRRDLDTQGIKDLNEVQCFILYNIGYSKMSVGDISNRGYYMGSNVTYNLKKMTLNGYITQEQFHHDKRANHISLSEKGIAIFKRFDAIFDSHAKNLPLNNIHKEELNDLHKGIQKLEAFWRFTNSHGITF